MTAKADISGVVAWLIEGARSATTPETMIVELCERVVACGIPVWRAAMFVRTLHPQIMGRRIEWREGTGVLTGEASFEVFDTLSFRDSPIARVYQTARPVRVRLDDPKADVFPQLNELRAEGGTEYLAFPVKFTNGEVHVGVWVTRRRGGFTEDHRAVLDRITAPLTRIVEIYSLRRTATNLLDTYVGNDAGARILAGHIRRGYTETIRAVIWLSDMRGFTALCDRMELPVLLDLLNHYFDCQVPAIQRHGGDILKFMGDGLLAIFPFTAEDDPTIVCRAALAAAREVRGAVAALADWPSDLAVPGPRYGLGLHIGEFLYGNIGAANRLDFTSIGPAVNLTARLEGLSRGLHRTTLLSAEFAAYCGAELVALGEFALAGFRAPEPVFGLADE